MNVDQILPELYKKNDVYVDDNCRDLTTTIGSYVEKKGALPEKAQAIFNDMKSVEAVAFGRARCTVSVLIHRNLVSESLAKILQENGPDLGAIDTMITGEQLWMRIWKWLLADFSPVEGKKAKTPKSVDMAHSLEFAQRLDQGKVMLNPVLGNVDVKSEAPPDPAEEGESKAGGEGSARTPDAKKNIECISLLKYTGNFAIWFKKAKDSTAVDWIPMNVVDDFVDAAKGNMNAHLKRSGLIDVGHSYCEYQRDGKKPPIIKISKANQSQIRFVFSGDVSPTPFVGSVRLCTCWGIDFYVLPQKDFEHGRCTPAWCVPEAVTIKENKDNNDGDIETTKVTNKTNENMRLETHTCDFEFTYKTGNMLPEEKQQVKLTFYALIADPKTVKKNDVLKRPPFPANQLVSSTPGEDKLKSLTKQSVVSPPAKTTLGMCLRMRMRVHAYVYVYVFVYVYARVCLYLCARSCMFLCACTRAYVDRITPLNNNLIGN